MEHQNSGGRRVDNSASHEPRRSAPQKKSSKKRGGRVKTVLKVLGTLFLVGVLTVAIFMGIFLTYVKTVLAPDLVVNLDDFTMDETSIVYYQDTDTGEWRELEYLYGDENRIWLDYDEIPEYAINAAIAIEDQRFRTHNGVDWKRTAGAVVNMFFGMRNTFGGSTITQQVVKNVTGDNDNTVKRKITEIFRALELEKNYTKEQIMETYLNKITFGGQVYGLGASAKTYFNKEAKDLTLAQCASIIAITNNPSIYDPLFKNEVSRYIENDDGERELVTKDTVGWNKYRQETILHQMLKQGLITQAEYDQAVAEKLVFYGTDEYEALYGPVVEETEVTLYLPNDNADGFETVTETVQANPQGIVDALIAHDALPEGVTVNDFRMENNGTETTEGDDAIVSYTPGDSQIFLDVSQAFGDAAATTGTAGETMLLGSLVNTMLTYYNAEMLTLTVDGAVLETGHNVYDTPFTMMELE